MYILTTKINVLYVKSITFQSYGLMLSYYYSVLNSVVRTEFVVLILINVIFLSRKKEINAQINAKMPSANITIEARVNAIIANW